MQALKWIASHPAETFTIAMVVLSVLGAILPAESKAGQIVRRIAADLMDKNLKAAPPASVQAESKETK